MAAPLQQGCTHFFPPQSFRQGRKTGTEHKTNTFGEENRNQLQRCKMFFFHVFASFRQELCHLVWQVHANNISFYPSYFKLI